MPIDLNPHDLADLSVAIRNDIKSVRIGTAEASLAQIADELDVDAATISRMDKMDKAFFNNLMHLIRLTLLSAHRETFRVLARILDTKVVSPETLEDYAEAREVAKMLAEHFELIKPERSEKDRPPYRGSRAGKPLGDR